MDAWLSCWDTFGIPVSHSKVPGFKSWLLFQCQLLEPSSSSFPCALTVELNRHLSSQDPIGYPSRRCWHHKLPLDPLHHDRGSYFTHDWGFRTCACSVAEMRFCLCLQCPLRITTGAHQVLFPSILKPLPSDRARGWDSVYTGQREHGCLQRVPQWLRRPNWVWAVCLHVGFFALVESEIFISELY